MATLPNIPVNSAATIGVLAGIALVGYTATLRHKLDAQIHENYKSFKLVDAGMQPETKPELKLAKD
jgi:hypothetical protein